MTTHAQHGFTLVEMLVIITILAVMVGVVGVNLGGDSQRALRNEAEHLALFIEAGRDEAIARGTPLAWSFDQGKIMFWQRDAEQKWTSFGDDLIKAQIIDPDLEIADLKINNVRVPLASKVVLSPDGANASFMAEMRSNNDRLTLSGDLLGRVQVKTSGS